MQFLFTSLAGIEPIWSLLPLSAALGVCMLWTFGRLSNQAAIKRTRNRLKASLFEMRLFGDEPGLVFRAQRDLLTGNAKLLALTLQPSLILSLPLILLLSCLDPFYGRTPLPLGAPAIVTVHLLRPLEAGVKPELQAPAGIVVETPAVRSLADNEVSWRIRPERAVDGKLRFVLPGEVVEKDITAGERRAYASGQRAASWLDWLFFPGEARLASANLDRISIDYPSATVTWLGLDLHWIAWLLIFSIATALVLKRRMGVSF